MFFSFSLSQLWFVQRKLAQKLAINKFKTLQTIVFVWSCFFLFRAIIYFIKMKLISIHELNRGNFFHAFTFHHGESDTNQIIWNLKKMIFTFQFIENCVG